MRAECEIRAMPAHAMIPRGGGVDIRMELSEGGRSLTEGELAIRMETPQNKSGTAAVRIDHSGFALFPFRVAPEDAGGIYTLSITCPGSNVRRDIFVDVVDQAFYRAMEAAAGNARFDALPARLLFIGDSLTERPPGFNYVEKVGFWLQKIHGSAVTVKNAGVAGDFITRVWKRLNRDADVHRPEAYDGIFIPVPTHVFFFLGHNDCKVSSASQYAEHSVSPDAFEKEYRLTMQKVRNETAARITVISAASSVYEITAETARLRRQEGMAHNFFGRPQDLELFNSIARKVADELMADYLDVYEPTRTHPDKKSLFQPDGVHMNNSGNRLVALEVLRSLGAGKASAQT